MVRSLPLRDGRRAAACEVLVRRHRALVRACVRRYQQSPEPAEDLMQVGYVGLLKAINNFDPEVGGSLAAYAQPCVSGEIKRHFRDKRWLVRVGRPVQELVLEVREATRELSQRLGHVPGEAELAAHLGRCAAGADGGSGVFAVVAGCTAGGPAGCGEPGGCAGGGGSGDGAGAGYAGAVVALGGAAA